MIDTKDESSATSGGGLKQTVTAIVVGSEVTREKGPHFLCHSSHLLLSSTIVTSSVGSS